MRRLAELARAAEQRNAPTGERNEAYVPDDPLGRAIVVGLEPGIR